MLFCNFCPSYLDNGLAGVAAQHTADAPQVDAHRNRNLCSIKPQIYYKECEYNIKFLLFCQHCELIYSIYIQLLIVVAKMEEKNTFDKTAKSYQNYPGSNIQDV